MLLKMVISLHKHTNMTLFKVHLLQNRKVQKFIVMKRREFLNYEKDFNLDSLLPDRFLRHRSYVCFSIRNINFEQNDHRVF